MEQFFECGRKSNQWYTLHNVIWPHINQFWIHGNKSIFWMLYPIQINGFHYLHTVFNSNRNCFHYLDTVSNSDGNRFYYLETVSNCFQTVSKIWKRFPKELDTVSKRIGYRFQKRETFRNILWKRGCIQNGLVCEF